MALDIDPQVEVKKATAIESRTKDLRDRMEADYNLWRLEPFEIPKTEGTWENFTVNSARVLADYIVTNLSTGKRRIWIPIESEKKRARENLSMTERLAIGLIEQADSINVSIPEMVDIQSDLSWNAAIRGWNVWRALLYMDEDNLVSDVKVWDPLNTFWISGTSSRNGLLWAAYKRYASEEDVKEQYGSDMVKAVDKQGRIAIQDTYDGEEEGVIIGDKYVHRWKHDLGYPPVFIRPVGASKLIQSGKHSDTIKDIGESCFVANRGIYESLHRLWSYVLTGAGRQAKSSIIIEYDSALEDLTPDDIHVDPGEKGHVTLLDKSKGQKVVGYVQPPNIEQVFAMIQGAEGMTSMGGIPPVALGSINQYMPASGLNILTHSAQMRLKHAKLNVERCFAEMAGELVAQYKNGEFAETEVSGVDKSNREFQAKIKPDKVETNRKFKAEIVVDMPQDEMQDIGMATQAIQAGLLSPQTARDRFHLVDDTDLEQEKIDKFTAEQMSGVKMWNLAKALLDDGNEFGAMIVLNNLAQATGMQPEELGKTMGMKQVRPLPNTMTAKAGQPQEIPNPNELQARLRG